MTYQPLNKSWDDPAQVFFPGKWVNPSENWMIFSFHSIEHVERCEESHPQNDKCILLGGKGTWAPTNY